MYESKFPTDDTNEEVKKLPNNLYFSIIDVSGISFTNYKPINLYFLWVPHDLLQLARNPQHDTCHDRVVRSGGLSQLIPRLPRCSPSCPCTMSNMPDRRDVLPHWAICPMCA